MKIYSDDRNDLKEGITTVEPCKNNHLIYNYKIQIVTISLLKKKTVMPINNYESATANSLTSPQQHAPS